MAGNFLPDTTPPGTAQAPIPPLPQAPIAPPPTSAPAPRKTMKTTQGIGKKSVINPRQKAALAAKRRAGKR